MFPTSSSQCSQLHCPYVPPPALQERAQALLIKEAGVQLELQNTKGQLLQISTQVSWAESKGGNQFFFCKI